jgi:ferredoxin-NADP reductase
MLQLRVEAIEPQTADTATFYLKEVMNRPVPYKAGQFITLVINHHGEEIRRSYSLSSSPFENMLAITVKRIANGEITRYLHTYAKPGDVWNVIEPAGRFTLPAVTGGKTLVYFAAGSGITPAFAHFKYLLAQPNGSKIILFYSNLNRASIIFKKELDQMEQKHPDRFTVTHLVSDEGKRLNNIVVEQLVRRYMGEGILQAEYYLCGPFTYMRMVRLTLLYMGIDAMHIHKENFVLETIPVDASVTNFSPRRLRINYQQQWHDLVTGENQTILQAALQNQLHLPYSCGSGVCAACAIKCKNGKVIMVKNEVLTNAELKQGWILTCTGYAVSDDVELNFDESF